MTDKSLFGITRFSKERLDQLSLSPVTKEFLNVIGLPHSSRSGLYFGDINGVSLPFLKDVPRLKLGSPQEYHAYIVIGEVIGEAGGEDRPICITEIDEQVIILDQYKAFEQLFVNTSVLQLAGTINTYSGMAEEAWLEDEEVLRENRIPLDFIDGFENEVQQLDPRALAPGTYWSKEIADLREGVQRFIDLPKYQIKMMGRMSEYDEAINLKEITIGTDYPVIRALAEFLAQCADGMEKYGNRWDHEHLRDQWSEWYSEYPDIIVYRYREDT